jgi:hypothetical protein
LDLSWANFFPLVFFPFKIIVLGIGMFFAIKWHHDEAKRRAAEAAQTQASTAKGAS